MYYDPNSPWPRSSQATPTSPNIYMADGPSDPYTARLGPMDPQVTGLLPHLRAAAQPATGVQPTNAADQPISVSPGFLAPSGTPAGQSGTAPTSPDIYSSTGFLAPPGFVPDFSRAARPTGQGYAPQPPAASPYGGRTDAPAYGLNYGRPQYTPAAQYARPYGNDGMYMPPQYAPPSDPRSFGNDGMYIPPGQSSAQPPPNQPQTGGGFRAQQQTPSQPGAYSPFGTGQPQFQPQQFQQLLSALYRLFGGGGYGGGYSGSYGTGIGNAPAAAYF